MQVIVPIRKYNELFSTALNTNLGVPFKRHRSRLQHSGMGRYTLPAVFSLSDLQLCPHGSLLLRPCNIEMPQLHLYKKTPLPYWDKHAMCLRRSQSCLSLRPRCKMSSHYHLFPFGINWPVPSGRRECQAWRFHALRIATH